MNVAVSVVPATHRQIRITFVATLYVRHVSIKQRSKFTLSCSTHNDSCNLRHILRRTLLCLCVTQYDTSLILTFQVIQFNVK